LRLDSAPFRRWLASFRAWLDSFRRFARAHACVHDRTRTRTRTGTRNPARTRLQSAAALHYRPRARIGANRNAFAQS